MLIISYDIKSDKMRTKFSKMLSKNGCIRLQFSVYEFNNNSRLVDNIKENIKNKFEKQFTFEDSVVIFEVDEGNVKKYGNAIHRDEPILYF